MRFSDFSPVVCKAISIPSAIGDAERSTKALGKEPNENISTEMIKKEWVGGSAFITHFDTQCRSSSFNLWILH